jgi:anti-sigma B factor antagonist
MNEASLTIHTEEVDEQRSCVYVAGRLDASNAQMLRETLTRLIEGGITHVVVDLAQVPFIDSAGLAALVSALKLARRAEGNVLLSGVQPQARTVFSLTMLDQIFSIHPGVEVALDSLQQTTKGK